MRKITLDQLDILDIGNSIQLSGSVFSGHGKHYLVAFPGEQLVDGEIELLELDAKSWEDILYQSDVLNVELIGPAKALFRKSQRVIDSQISWNVFERDGYRCRYCGQRRPLTVDHVDLYEAGGVTVEANLTACCRRCNRTRGNMPYDEWIASPAYQQISLKLGADQVQQNALLLSQLAKLREMRTAHVRSR